MFFSLERLLMMATTKIWPVKNHLKRVLDYTSNPEKTDTLDDIDFQFNGLSQSIHYTTQDMKTEKQLYVTGINTHLSTAFEDMVLTKKTYSKEDGILAFHGYQSFKPGEVDAETAHRIGIELANILWGDRFEVLVSTHIDKHHYHNHFVINSVSFKDGKRYYDNKATYKRMREVSDALCEKYQLSVIEDKSSHSRHYAEWKAEKENRPTKRSLVVEDVEYAISKSTTKKQFLKALKDMGYSIREGKYISLKPQGGERAFRLHKLTKDGRYDMSIIEQRLYERRYAQFESPAHISPKKYYYKGDLNKARKLTGFKALYVHYMFILGVIPHQRPAPKVHYYLKQDLLKLDQITEEVTFLAKKNINTIEELESCLEKTNTQKRSLEKERKCVYGKIKRCRNAESKTLLQQDVETMTEQIKSLRKEVVLYERIKDRSLKMKSIIKSVNDNQKDTKINKEYRNVNR